MSYAWERPTDEDIRIVTEQLGRKPEGMIGVAVRDRYGWPQVIVTWPLRWNKKSITSLPAPGEKGTVSVFPTLLWLTCPYLSKAIGRLESVGWIGRMKEELNHDSQAAAQLLAAHQRTATLRESMVAPRVLARLKAEYPGQYNVLTASGVAGMREDEGDDHLGVKCLHAHFADYLTFGDNPIGRRVWGLLTAAGVDPRGLAEDTTGHAGDDRHIQSPSAAFTPLPAAKSAPTRNVTAAVIDVGSNSVRLLVARRQTGRWHEMARRLATTRLGAGPAEELSNEAMDRTITALKQFRDLAAGHGAAHPFAVATEAVRQAGNREHALVHLWEQSGVAVRLISGTEEGELSLLGAVTTVALPAHEPVLVCDVGGASTELIYGTASGQVVHVVSLPYGAVTYYKSAVGEPATANEYANQMAEEVGRHLAAWGVSSRDTRFIAVGGTATALAAWHQELDTYDPSRINGYTLTAALMRQQHDRMRSLTVAQRRQLPGMEASRADILPYGLHILRTIHGAWAKSADAALIVSDGDLLQGVLQRYGG